MSNAPLPRFFGTISAVFTSVFSVAGLFVVFYALFLHSRGLTTEQIGYAMSAMAFAKIVSVVLVSFLIDKSRYPHFYMIGAALSAAFMTGVTFVSDLQGWIFIPLTFFYSLAFSINVPLSEGFAMRACRLDKTLNYGRMRLFGSASFLLAGIVAGRVIEALGNDYSYFLLLVMGASLAIAVCGLTLPNFYKLEHEHKIICPNSVSTQNMLKMVQNNLPLMIVILGASIMHSGHAVLFQYATVAWSEMGYNNEIISYFMAIGVVAEVILFWFAGSIDKYLKTRDYFLLSAIGSIIRWFAMGFAPTGFFIFFFQMFHIFSFGTLHLGVMRYIRENLEGNYHGAAQLIYGGMMWGVAMIPASAAAGHLCEAFGSGAYFFMALIALMGGVIAMLPFLSKSRMFKKKMIVA